MANKRMINTKIWEDAWFNELDPIEKLFFIYLLTNPMTNILGVYELSKGTIGRATGLEKTVVNELLERFEKAEKVYYREGWVVISNFIKHQNYKSPKIVSGMNKELEDVPENIRILIKSPIKLYGIDTVSHIITNTNTKSNTNKKEKSSKYKFEQKDLELATLLKDKILENTPTFNEPKNLAPWAEIIRLMREQDKRTFEQIEVIILWAQRNDFWQANILSAKKLRKQFDTLVSQMKRDAKMSSDKKAKIAFA